MPSPYVQSASNIYDAAGTLVAAGAGSAVWLPSDQGLLAQTFDVALTGSGGAALTSGTLYFARLRIPSAVTVSNVLCLIMSTNAVGLSAAYLGLYNSSGVLVAQTADRHSDAAWTSNPAVETAPLTAPYAAAADLYWVGILLTFATTSPGVGRVAVGNGATVNAGLAAATGNLRFATHTTTGLSTLPGSFSPGSQMAGDVHAWWFGLS